MNPFIKFLGGRQGEGERMWLLLGMVFSWGLF